MRRGEAWKPLREHGKWMRLSERAVFYALLERSDNADCSIPAHMTPSLIQLAEACCCSPSTVKLALAHLEAHGWIERKRISRPGRGHKTTYQLDHGWLCTPTCEYRQPRQKGADSRPLSREKGADSRPEKEADSHLENRRSDPVSPEGLRGGKVREGKGEESRSGTTPETCWPDPDQHWLYGQPSGAMGDWPEGSIGEDANRAVGKRAVA